LFAASVLVLTACGGADLVATVDGAEVFEDDVEALFVSDGAVTTEKFSDELLNTIVEYVVIDAAADQFGITFDEAAIEEQRAEFEQQILDSGSTYQEFLDQQQRTDAWITRVAHQQLVAEAVQEALVASEGAITEDDLRRQYESQLYNLTEACTSHILLDTEEDALDVKARLDDGEDFATLAQEVSTGPSGPNGGDLGCGSLGQFVPEYAQGALDAVIGEPTDPVQSQFGFHIILVGERTTPEFEEVEDDLRSQLESLSRGNLLQDWLLEVLGAADITIEEKYGTWTTSPAPQVLPPQ
jgi:parvulin-like peptidyl-prolyl isomerase